MSNTKPLAKFMKKLSRLPDDLKSSFREIEDLDRETEAREERLRKILAEVGAGSPSRSQKQLREQQEKRYHQLISIIDEMEAKCRRKVELASTSYETVDKYIIDLDKSYLKFTQSAQQPAVEPKKGPKNTSRKRKHTSEAETDATTADSMAFSDFDSPLVEMPVDPNEPTYCFCHQVSFGQMIMCDNKNCPIEWFHFQCVGLTQVPKGKWYCEQCKDKVSKRGRKPSAPV